RTTDKPRGRGFDSICNYGSERASHDQRHGEVLQWSKRFWLHPAPRWQKRVRPRERARARRPAWPQRGSEGLLRHSGRPQDRQDPGGMIADETIMRPALARAADADPAGKASAAHIPGASLLSAVEAVNRDDVCRTCGACCSYSADWPRFSLESEARLDRIPR